MMKSKFTLIVFLLAIILFSPVGAGAQQGSPPGGGGNPGIEDLIDEIDVLKARLTALETTLAGVSHRSLMDQVTPRVSSTAWATSSSATMRREHLRAPLTIKPVPTIWWWVSYTTIPVTAAWWPVCAIRSLASMPASVAGSRMWPAAGFPASVVGT